MKPDPLIETICDEIFRHPMQMISFRRFMECCLYHPVGGYYCRDWKQFGKQGDFFTNVQVGSLFGRILAKSFLQMRSTARTTGKWALIEMGAGDGQLMNQIISFFHQQSVEDVDFYIVEKRPRVEDSAPPVVWVHQLEEIPVYPFAVIFSNELVDAFPVHRLQKKAGKIDEIFVTWDAHKKSFQTINVRLSHSALIPYVKELEDQVEEGQYFEVNLDAKKWLQSVAAWLKEGYLVTIDYGGQTEELLTRKEGTIRYFQKHRLVESDDLQPGEVDITANVNFTWLQDWGKEFGLDVIFYGTQTKFFLREDLSIEVRNQQERNQLKQLIHPDGMGEVFRVLIQKKKSGN